MDWSAGIQGFVQITLEEMDVGEYVTTYYYH